MISVDSYLQIIEMAQSVIALVDLTNIQIINNNSTLNDADKRKAKIEYLNKHLDKYLDKYDGNDKQKLQSFCSNELKMQPHDNLNTCKVGSILLTQLGHAASCGDIAIMEWLLSKGVDVNSDVASGWGDLQCGLRALHIAARTNKSSVVEFLVKNNADVNLRTFSSYYHINVYSGFSNAGSTALTEAVRYGSVETFKELLATTQVGKQSLTEAYGVTKKILCLLQKEPDYITRLRLDPLQMLNKQFMNDFLESNKELLKNYPNQELNRYIGLMNVKEGIKSILAYIENIENSVFILFGMKRGVEKSGFAVLPLDIFKNVASFLFPQDPFIIYRIKVTEQKIRDKRLSTLFFSLITKKLNSSAINNAMFNKYIEDHGANKRTAGALVLRR